MSVCVCVHIYLILIKSCGVLASITTATYATTHESVPCQNKLLTRNDVTYHHIANYSTSL